MISYRSSSRSRSKSPAAAGVVQFITSFGGESSDDGVVHGPALPPHLQKKSKPMHRSVTDCVWMMWETKPNINQRAQPSMTVSSEFQVDLCLGTESQKVSVWADPYKLWTVYVVTYQWDQRLWLLGINLGINYLLFHEIFVLIFCIVVMLATSFCSFLPVFCTGYSVRFA